MKILSLFFFLLICDQAFCQDKSATQIYDIVQQMPEYPGGEDSMWQFINANIKYPDSAAGHNIQGRIVAGFIVNEDGAISDIKIRKSLSWDIDSEGLRVIKLFPRFTPGLQDGKAVKVNFYLPILFKLKPISSYSIKKHAAKEYIANYSDEDLRTLKFLQKNRQYIDRVLKEYEVIEDSILSDSVKKAQDHQYKEPMGEWAIDTNKVYDQKLGYPGGDTALWSFVAIHLNYPKGPREKDIEGKVIVGMTINEDGGLSDFKIIKSVHPDLDAEALRVVKLFPKHRPVFQKGKVVKVDMQVPVNFKIREVNSYY
jgi:TonB family protein